MRADQHELDRLWRVSGAHLQQLMWLRRLHRVHLHDDDPMRIFVSLGLPRRGAELQLLVRLVQLRRQRCDVCAQLRLELRHLRFCVSLRVRRGRAEL